MGRAEGAGGAGEAGGVGAVAHAAVHTKRSARAIALAHAVQLLVRVFEVGVPVETVFVETQEAP